MFRKMSQEETSETSFEEVDPCQADGSGEEGWQEPPWEWGSWLILEPTRAWHTVGCLQGLGGWAVTWEVLCCSQRREGKVWDKGCARSPGRATLVWLRGSGFLVEVSGGSGRLCKQDRPAFQCAFEEDQPRA